MLQEVTLTTAKSYLNAAAASFSSSFSSLASDTGICSSEMQPQSALSSKSGVIFASKSGAACGLGFVYGSSGKIGKRLRLLCSTCISFKDVLFPSLPLLSSCCRLI